MYGTQILTLIVLIVLSAFFSGSETALISLSMIKVKSLLRQKRKGAKSLYRLKQNPQRLIITILIGNNLVNIWAAAIATSLFTKIFGSSGVGIATGVMTFLVLVFGEITPKTFATENAERMSLMISRPIEILSIILLPFVKFFHAISIFMSRILGSRKEKKLSEDELKTIVTMGVEEGILNKEAAEMIHNILEFEGTKVTEIMTPNVDIKMVDGNKRLKEVIDFVIKSPFSRYPVYINDNDKIVGILDIDDVLRYIKDRKLNVKVKNISRKPFFVPESKEIDDLLTEFEGKETPIAMVVDEYGDIIGMVTMEDILEEIVGDIFDKSKKTSVYIKKINNKLIKVDAKAPVEDINKTLNLGLDEKHFNTIAGFIEGKLQRIPNKGEKIKLKDAVIIIDKVTSQGIKSVRIIKV